MGTKTRIAKHVKESLEVNKDFINKFIKSLPKTVQEVKTFKKMKGSEIIVECLNAGNKEEALKHDSEVKKLLKRLSPFVLIIGLSSCNYIKSSDEVILKKTEVIYMYSQGWRTGRLATLAHMENDQKVMRMWRQDSARLVNLINIKYN